MQNERDFACNRNLAFDWKSRQRKWPGQDIVIYSLQSIFVVHPPKGDRFVSFS